MCGRFALRVPADEIRRNPVRDGFRVEQWVDQERFIPRYNIAPRTYAPVIRRRDGDPSGGDSSSGCLYILQSMKWGLVPHWSKFEDKSLSTTNARSENLVDGGGMWGSIKGKKRCAVICQGYYEWLTNGKDKLPHFTKHKDGQLMLMAGLYDCVTLEGQEKSLWTFSIVTTAANKDFDWLHDRQPVILSTPAALETWLDTSCQSWTSELSKLVDPYSDESSPLECYQVPKEIGKVGTESPSFIEPVYKRKDGIEAMFIKQNQASRIPLEQSSQKRQQSLSKLPTKSDLISGGATRTPKRRRFEDIDDKDQILGEQPSPSKQIKTTKAAPKSPRRKDVLVKDAQAPGKITSFFQKR